MSWAVVVVVVVSLAVAWSLPGAGAGASPSIYLTSPAQSSSFLLTEKSRTLSLPLEYQLFGVSGQEGEWEVCFEVKTVTNSTPNIQEQSVATTPDDSSAVPFTCVPSSNTQLTLQNLSEGEFLLHAVVRERATQALLPSSKIVHSFAIYSRANITPRIVLADPSTSLAEEEIVIAQQSTQTGSFTLRFGFSKTPLPVSQFAPCVWMTDLVSQQTTLPLQCLTASDRQLTLNHLPVGQYEIHLLVRDLSLSSSALEDSWHRLAPTVNRRLRVIPLSQAIPRLVSTQPVQEYLADSVTGTATVSLPMTFVGESAAIAQVAVCLQVQDPKSDKILMDWQCLPSTQSLITLQNMKKGDFTVRLAVGIPLPGKHSLPRFERVESTLIEQPVAIRAAEELIPTYEWQPLHVWHSIPAGLQTRLPLSEHGRKEARIPEPWRLQLPLPSPCKYFVRMDVNRHTKLSEIREQASKSCSQFRAECFRLQVNGQVLEDYEHSSAQSTDLFSAEKHILFNDICLEQQ